MICLFFAAAPVSAIAKHHSAKPKPSHATSIQNTSANSAKSDVGVLEVEVVDAQAEVFIVSYPAGLTFTADDRVGLRDALLARRLGLPLLADDHVVGLRDALLGSSPIKKGTRQILKPGHYVIALKRSYPREAAVLSELGKAAPNNVLIGPSEDGDSEFVVGNDTIHSGKLASMGENRIGRGGGIRAGALFKSVDDIYRTYTGAFFVTGPGVENSENVAKYNYLKLQGTKDIMFRFVKGEPTFELWLLSECDVGVGTVAKISLRIPSESD
jgi:hypothetical protein